MEDCTTTLKAADTGVITMMENIISTIKTCTTIPLLSHINAICKSKY
jgi:hypothetical protein